jgi:outer membrane protein TolC
MNDGTDFMSIGASLPIPFDYANSNNAKKAQYLALAEATQQQKLSVEDEISAEIEKNIATWQRAYRQERNYEDVLIPQAVKTLESALLAYETDRADFFSVYSSELDLIHFERVIRKARITTWQMKVKIEMLTGNAVEEVEQQNEITVTP